VWQDQTVGGGLLDYEQAMATFLQVGPGFGIWIAYMACTLVLTPAMAFWSAVTLFAIIVIAEIAGATCLAASTAGVTAGAAAKAREDRANAERRWNN